MVKKFGFPQQARLKTKSDFTTVIRRGKKYNSLYITMFFFPRPESVQEARLSRIGISVSRKVGLAYKRNYIKRTLRETFRLHRERFCQLVDIVIICKPLAAQVSGEVVAEQFLYLLKKAHVLT